MKNDVSASEGKDNAFAVRFGSLLIIYLVSHIFYNKKLINVFKNWLK